MVVNGQTVVHCLFYLFIYCFYRNFMLSLYCVLITNIRWSTLSKTDDVSLLLNNTFPVTHLWNICMAMESCETNIRTCWKKLHWYENNLNVTFEYITYWRENRIRPTESIIRPKLVLMRWSLEKQIDDSLREWIRFAYGPGVEPISDIVCRTRAMLAMLADCIHFIESEGL